MVGAGADVFVLELEAHCKVVLWSNLIRRQGSKAIDRCSIFTFTSFPYVFSMSLFTSMWAGGLFRGFNGPECSYCMYCTLISDLVVVQDWPSACSSDPHHPQGVPPPPQPSAPLQLTGKDPFTAELPNFRWSWSWCAYVGMWTSETLLCLTSWMPTGDKTSSSLKVLLGTSCPHTNKGQHLRPT